jgi:hypothetical protein
LEDAFPFLTKDPIGFAGGDVNLYRHVQNNPITWVDPWGLWSFSLEFYPVGIGYGITAGQNPGGELFIKWRVGFGFGGGFSVDPSGKSPGWDKCREKEHGFMDMGIGMYTDISAGVGPFSFSFMDAAVGAYTPMPTGDFWMPYSEFGEKLRAEYDWEKGIRARFGIIAGIEGFFIQNPIRIKRNR